MGVCTAKGCRGRPQTSPVFIAPDSPPQRRNPCVSGKAICNRKEQLLGRAHLARQYASCGQSSLEARLRTRKVTGRDASLPAPLLSAFGILVARGTVGALPQTPQGTLSLDPARGRRKGTKSPLDPFSRLSWSRFHAPSACSFLVLRLSPCLLPTTSREEPGFLPFSLTGTRT